MAAVTLVSRRSVILRLKLQCGRGAMAAVTRRVADVDAGAVLASMWPRRDGRGDRCRTRHDAHVRRASMWPRRDGRGDEIAAIQDVANAYKLQCGRGAMAAVTQHLDFFDDSNEVLQCGRGAMAAVTRRGRVSTNTQRCASMWPRRDGRGDAVRCSRHRRPRDRFNVAAARWPR